MKVQSTSITYRGLQIDHEDLYKRLSEIIYPAYLSS